jgi:hypothetical protein
MSGKKCIQFAIRSRALAVLYSAVTVTVIVRCDWMRRTKTMGSHLYVKEWQFCVYVRTVSPCCKFPTHTKCALILVSPLGRVQSPKIRTMQMTSIDAKNIVFKANL